MAKYYTEQAPTPVFAVTFVSNRNGITPPKETTTNNNTSNQLSPQEQAKINEYNNKIKPKLDEYKADLKKLETLGSNLLTKDIQDKYGNQEGYKKKFGSTILGGSVRAYIQILINDINYNLPNIEKSVNTALSKVEDNEYLVYSNLEIQSIGPTDLSQQSNWYLRDADVELTRDMPVCKAKLIVAAKLNDDGSIPNIKQVENGFIYEQSVINDEKGKPTDKVDFTFIPGGRFLSADDEVRIYAGYKNESCITMNDLDQYPFDFGTLTTKELDNVSKQQLLFLDKQKTAIQNAIETLKNPFTDPTLALNIQIALLPLLITPAPVVGGATALPNAINVSSKALSVPSATTPTVINAGTRSLSTNVLSRSTSITTTTSNTVNNSTIAANKQLNTNVLPRTASNSASTNAALNPPASNIDLLATQAYNKAIASGLGITAATIIALNLVLSASANAEQTSPKEIKNIYPEAITRDYLEGRQYLNDNKQLFNLLNIELDSINKLIQVVQKKAGTDVKQFSSSKDKIAPIFWGFIDSVDFISNSEAGVQIIYNLRDRSRILADTKLVTLPYLNKDNNERGAFEGLRHKTIEGVYRATNGGVYLDNNYISATNIQWREGFNVGEVITLYDNKIDVKGNRISDQVDIITNIGDALAQQRIKYSAAIENQAQWVIANSFLSSKDIKDNASLSKYDPLFHIWTLQPPVVQGGGQSVMQIVNKSPFEILAYLQVTEVMPIDVFSSHVNGHFLFAPRVLDTSGLNDPERGNRLYFFFQCFDKTPEARNLIKDIRVQTSTIGVYNRFAIANSDFNNPTNASLNDLYTVVDIASANTKNRKVPIKQHIIVDPKVKSQSNPEGYAQGLALTTASIMARDNTTVIFKVIGDSTFYPGEAVRVYNTVLHGKDTFTFNSQTESTPTFLRDLYQEVQKLRENKGAVKQGGSQNKVVNLNDVINRIRKGSGTLSNDSDDLNAVLPMYKVRSITHSLKAAGSDAGYTTKIVAIADIL